MPLDFVYDKASSSYRLEDFETDEKLLERVRNDRSLVPKAIDEAIRFEPVATFKVRQASKDLQLAGVDIPKGAMVQCIVISANRDEQVFADSETFNIDRDLKPSFGFGFGPHTCIGQFIAKAELQVAVNAILDYRRVMDVYRLSYFSVQDYKGEEYEMNLKSISILSDEDLGIEDSNDRKLLTTLFSSMHKSEKKFGSLEGKRCDSVKNLIRYQRSAVSKLSKALARSL